MERLNASGRTYVEGWPLSADFRASLIDEKLRNGGDIHTGYFPGRLEDVAKRFNPLTPEWNCPRPTPSSLAFFWE